MRRLFPIVFSLISLSGFAQTSDDTIKPENINIASPNAAALGKVADIPVSYQTGIPNVSIPIYTIKEGPLQLPISLSYHASGLKTMEQSSWVGAGWSLNAGGMISRSVRGLADEFISPNGPSGSNISYLSSRGYFNYLFTNDGGGTYDPAVLPGNVGLDWARFSGGQKDGEADLFTFNFNGYSGKFYFRPDNSVVLAPQQDIRVTPLFCNGTGCNPSFELLYGWIVTTPDGVKYYFGKTILNTNDVDPLEYTQSYSPTSGPTFVKTISSWFLYKIESPDSKFAINLSYSAENFSSYSLSLYPVPMAGGQGFSMVKNFMYGVRLTSASFSNGTVAFNTISTPRQDLSAATPVTLTDTDQVYGGNPSTDYNAKFLDNIQITGNGNSTYCQTFAFAYDYFYDNTHPLKGSLVSLETTWNIHSDKKRLKLNSITEKTCDGTVTKPPHVFTYFEETSVPRTLTLAQDHWGYFNGQTNNATLIPAVSADGGISNIPGYNANRESSWPAMRAGSLQKIQYPTGGYARFAFHNHEVYVPITGMDSVYIGIQNAAFTDVSPGIPFTITATTTFKSRVKYYNGGSGTVSVGPNSTGLNIFTLSAGTYNFNVHSNSNTYGAIECTLYKFTPTYTQYFLRPVGGLRLDTLIYNNGLDANQVVQTFSYVDANGTTQGVLYSRPNYIAQVRNDLIQAAGGIPNVTDLSIFFDTDGCVAYDDTRKAYFISPASVHPMKTVQGNHFGYNQVKVTQSDGGYTIYKFTLHGNPDGDVCGRFINAAVCDVITPSPNYPPAPPSFDFGRDEMINKSVYNAAGTLLHENRYATTYTPETIGVRGLIAKTVVGSTVIATEYEIKTSKKTLISEEDLTYNATGQAPVYRRTDTYFDSPYHSQSTKVVVSDSIGRKVLSEHRKVYTPDLVNPIGYVADNYTGTLTTSLANRLSTYNSAVSGCSGMPISCKFKAWLHYMYDPNEDRKTYVTSKRAADSTFNKNITGSSVWNAANADVKALIKLRNRNQITPIESSAWRDGLFMESAYLTYKDFGNDSIQIYPVKYEVIKVQSPGGSFIAAGPSSTNLLKDSKYKQEEVYTYSNGKPVEVTGKNGVTTSYVWDYYKAEPVAMVVNAASANIAYTGFESDGNGNWTIGSPSRQSLTPFFGSKYYDVHQGNITKTVSSSQSYVVSFWSTGSNITVNSSSPTAVGTKNGWTNYQITVSGATLVTISAGVTANIDELRLYPSNSQMTTYSYDPLIGITLQADPNGQVMRYNYDTLGRLIYITDQDSKILKKYTYNYYSQTNNN